MFVCAEHGRIIKTGIMIHTDPPNNPKMMKQASDGGQEDIFIANKSFQL